MVLSFAEWPEVLPQATWDGLMHEIIPPGIPFFS
jgi:hypothetical protein